MMTPRQDSPLYERDPQAWIRHLAEGNRTQPRKRVAAEVLAHDTAGRLLLVDPSYKPGWDIPGGMAEANEPPLHAARRELREELGLDLGRMALLCVDWVAPHGPWDDLLVFVFDGGVLTLEEAADVHPVDDEIADVGFFTHTEAQNRLRGDIWHRTQKALSARNSGCPTYTHNGHTA